MSLQNALKQESDRELSERRNIILARSRLALMYARRKQISQPMVDAMGTLLTVEAQEIF